MSRTRAYSHAVAHGNDTLLEETDQSAVMMPAGAGDQSSSNVFVVLFIVRGQSERGYSARFLSRLVPDFLSTEQGKYSALAGKKIRISREKILVSGKRTANGTERRRWRLPARPPTQTLRKIRAMLSEELVAAAGSAVLTM
jgi:hypothetical protein